MFRWLSRYKQRRREGASRRRLVDAAGQKAERAAKTFYGRCGELATLAGRFLYVMVFGVVVGAFGSVQGIADLHKSPGFWIALMLLFFVVAFAVIAYRALVERDNVRAGAGTSASGHHLHLPRMEPGETVEGTMPGGDFKITKLPGKQQPGRTPAESQTRR